MSTTTGYLANGRTVSVPADAVKDWKYEVENGDTVLGLGDWYTKCGDEHMDIIEGSPEDMNSFIASNKVTLSKHGYYLRGFATPERIHEAQKEFYQHLQDKELSRWRDPEEPNFVVYTTTPDNPNCIRVVDETSGESVLHLRNKKSSPDGGDTASRYLAEHLKKKPWHFAIEGTLWEVEHSGLIFIAIVSDKAEFIFTDKSSASITDEGITDAKRIWPQ